MELSSRQPTPEYSFSMMPPGEFRHQRSLKVETILPEDPRFADAQLVEYQVFKGEQYTQEKNQTSLSEYAPYDQDSSFEVAYNDTNEIMGVMREIRNTRDQELQPGRTGFKTLDDFPLFLHWQQYFNAISSQTILEVGTAAVPAEFRNPNLQVVDHLYHNLYVHAMSEGRTNLIASIDNRLLTLYRRYFNFHPIGPTIEDYMGSPTTPVFSDVNMMANHLKTTSSQRYRRMILGDFSA